MIPFLKFLSRKRTLFILFGLIVLLELLLIYVTHKIEVVSGSRALLDTQFSYTPQEAYQILQHMGAAGRSYYLKGLLIDLIFPASYSLFMAGMIFRFLWNRHLPHQRAARLAFLPLSAGLFDYLENLNEFRMVLSFPQIQETWAVWGSRFTLLKWSTLIISLILLLVLWLGQIVRDLKRGTLS